MLPNFLIVGAPKSGTTSLYNYLKKHPEIYMSPTKEINFFSFKYIPTQHKNEITIEDYETYFEGVRDAKCIGECSPSYLRIPNVARDIKNVLPDCKIIIILRNPVKRILSHFVYSKANGFNRGTFDSFLNKSVTKEDNNWFSKPTMIQAGMYYRQVKTYIDVFERTNVFVTTFDSLKENSSKLLKDVYDFLDVDISFLPDLNLKYNVGVEPIIPLISQLIIKPNRFKYYVKYLVPPKYREKVNESVQKRILYWNMGPVKEKIKEESKKKLLDIYRDDIQKLEKLLFIDLSSWLR